MDDRHAPRRIPRVPQEPLDLTAAAAGLLETARSQRSGRAAMNLLPGSSAPLTQTLMALRKDAVLADHASPGPASIQVVEGTVVLRWENGARELSRGEWTPIPDAVHGLSATTDAVALLTVAHR